MIYATLVLLLSPAFAGDLVFSSYCAAALEARSRVTPERFDVLESTLTALVERIAHGHEMGNLPDVTPGSLVEAASRRFDLKLGLVKDSKFGPNPFRVSRELVRLRKHVDRLTTDVLSIQDGVVAGVTLIRGREAILAHFDEVSERARRNEEAFRRVSGQALPYATRLRLTRRGLQAAALISYGLAYATTFAFIRSPLEYSASEWMGVARDFPAELFVGYLLFPGAIYQAGFLNGKAAGTYERLYGTRRSSRQVDRFRQVENIVRDRRYTDRTLSYQSGLTTLSETDRFDLQTAVDQSLPPAARFYVSQEKDALDLSADPPWTYVFAIDQAFFVHEGEPTLLFMHRIVRANRASKTRRRKDRETTAEKSWIPGSPLPAGA